MSTFRFMTSVCILLISLAFMGCAITSHTDTKGGDIQLDTENGIVVPYKCNVYLSFVGGEAAADTELGIGTSEENFKTVFTGLPNTPFPASEVKIGKYKKGARIPLCLKSKFSGSTYYAFWGRSDNSSTVAFKDTDNTLGLDGNTIVKSEGNSIYTIYLDDAVSFIYDDDDNDIIIRMRLER